MASASSSITTLKTLVTYGLLSSLPEVQDRFDRVLLKRTYDSDGNPTLSVLLGSELTVIDRLKIFFGIREFFFQTVTEIARAAVTSTSMQTLSGEEQAVVRHSITILNDKIQNNPQLHLLALPVIERRAQEPLERARAPVISRISPIRNSGNKCYLISMLTALTASEEFLRFLSSFSRGSALGIWLQLCLQEMKKNPDSVLSLHQSPFSHLLHELKKEFPGAGLFSWEQQDVHECMTILLTRVFRSACNIHWAEMVFEGEASETQALTNNIMSLRIPDGMRAFNVRNIGEMEKVRRKAPPIVYRTVLRGNPPRFLPLHVQRSFVEIASSSSSERQEPRNVRNTVEIVPAAFIEIPHEDGRKFRYALKSIIVHQGVSTDNGHYISYVVDPSRPVDERTGVATQYIRYDDGFPPEVKSWEQVRNQISKDGYIYLYDRVSSS